MTREFNPADPPILPAVQRDDSTWAGRMMDAAAESQAEYREGAREQAAAHLGIQAHDLEQHEPEPAKPSLLDQLSSFAKAPAGPSEETAARIAALKREHAEGVANTKERLRRELVSSMQRAGAAIGQIKDMAKQYRPVLQALREVPEWAFLNQLPQNEGSFTLVTRLRESIDAVVAIFDNGPRQLEERGQELDAAVEAIKNPNLSEQDRVNILHGRNALENLCEMPAQIERGLHGVVSYRQRIDKLVQEEAERVLTASELPQVERTVEQEKALVRATSEAVGRAGSEESAVLKRLRMA
jgi:hypothetical protein